MTARVVPDSRARRKGLPDLPEDFALAQRQRVEAGRHAEEMPRRVAAGAVEAGPLELRLVQAAPLRDEPRQGGTRAVVRREAVDLAPVAGRDDDALGDHAAAGEPGQRLADLVGRERDPLPDADAGAAEAPSEQGEPRFLGKDHLNACSEEK